MVALQAASEVAETDRIAAVRVETTRRITQLVPFCRFTVVPVAPFQTHHACTQTDNQHTAKGRGAVLPEPQTYSLYSRTLPACLKPLSR